ncbi:MAG: isoprenylcysteine carboxylmethyltransferase family protein [Planctomycetes bacterium]|nr:isoprenylcysteine carboxylmethyltransferase family protein [Planctomycetota bacterium]MCB9889033.1 isoprenylcysteine carboxylmethyltransferase family protein [Planctomycetota bacterium]
MLPVVLLVSVSAAKAVVLVAWLSLLLIRAPHQASSRATPIAERCWGGVETVLLALLAVAFLLPVLWASTEVFAATDYPPNAVALGAGGVCYGLGLWLFDRAHRELGPRWSCTLELRASHDLVTGGVYSVVRHPMYLAYALYAAGQAIALPNLWVGPSHLGAALLLLALRLRPEERMLRRRFGRAYEEYAARTPRLVPGVW